MAHTPGPWKISIDSEGESWAHKWPTIQAENYEVVGTEGLYGDFETDMANARLIATSPELLKALEMLYGAASKIKWEDSTHDGMYQAMTHAKSVISKAKGETE